jgi:vesicle coat complex subunit
LAFDVHSIVQVVANAVAALSEIAEQSPQTKVFDLNGPTINKLLTALNECTEWGQVFILDAIANYSPKVTWMDESSCPMPFTLLTLG